VWLAFCFVEPIERIKEILAPILDENNSELVNINIIRIPKTTILKVLVDKKLAQDSSVKRQGITLGKCIAINKQLGSIIEKEAIFTQNYELEVSSPGLDRLLKEKKDFERVIGEDIKLYIKEPIDGKDSLKATLSSVDEECINIKTKDDNMLRIPYSNIHKAKLEIRI